ncbi:N-acetyltransferase [Cyanidiococcus yangmingshanensis]|uniref:N-acetyltransferase n=1 Tax=Cyanidiococcus yangmingshanensis TaxID=2690220 RepID=A0A7J7IDH0_9RHOD|nr:N-acetyltransferase [Cyanidiococcus yangmingshanensis]
MCFGLHVTQTSTKPVLRDRARAVLDTSVFGGRRFTETFKCTGTTHSSTVSVMKNDTYIVRELCEADLARGFRELLAQLTKTGSASLETWQERYRFRQQNSATYLTLVAVDSTTESGCGHGNAADRAQVHSWLRASGPH